MDYFNAIVKSLRLEELEILAVLSEKDADVPFKAIKNSELIKLVNLTKFKHSKVLNRLQAMQFIDEIKNERASKVFITPFGVKALQKSLKGVEK